MFVKVYSNILIGIPAIDYVFSNLIFLLFPVDLFQCNYGKIFIDGSHTCDHELHFFYIQEACIKQIH